MATKQDKDKGSRKSSSNEKQNHAEHKEDKGTHKGNAAKTESKSDVAEDFDESEELDSLMDIFEDGNLASMDIEVANDLIDQWYEILHNSEDAEYKEIASSLKQLKKQVSSSKAQPEAIAELLENLGEQVDSAGNNAERGYKTKLHKLGKAIKRSSQNLEQDEEIEDEE